MVRGRACQLRSANLVPRHFLDRGIYRRKRAGSLFGLPPLLRGVGGIFGGQRQGPIGSLATSQAGPCHHNVTSPSWHRVEGQQVPGLSTGADRQQLSLRQALNRQRVGNRVTSPLHGSMDVAEKVTTSSGPEARLWNSRNIERRGPVACKGLFVILPAPALRLQP